MTFIGDYSYTDESFIIESNQHSYTIITMLYTIRIHVFFYKLYGGFISE